MSKAAVIYWSQTGNTEQMANAIADGIRDGGLECDLMNVAETNAADAHGTRRRRNDERGCSWRR